MTGYSDRARKDEWIVTDVPIAQARQLVETNHYAHGASNTAVALHGLFHSLDNQLYGVAWWIPPTKSAAMATYPLNWQGVLSLSRLVIVPGVAKNACTILMSRSRGLIDPVRWPCLVTYADVWQGHLGTIYRADNWYYCGMTKPERAYRIDGKMTSRKAGPKTRTHGEMILLGAELVGSFAKHKFVFLRDARGRKVNHLPA